MGSTPNEGGRALLAWRERKHLTQAQAAPLLGTSSQKVSDWECGRVRPGIDVAALIEDVAGVPMRAWSKPVARRRAA